MSCDTELRVANEQLDGNVRYETGVTRLSCTHSPIPNANTQYPVHDVRSDLSDVCLPRA